MVGVRVSIPILLEKIRKETAFLSSTTEIRSHPAFKEIVSREKLAVSYLLGDLLHEPSWVPLWALSDIFAGKGPSIPEESLGRLYEITYLWLRWAYNHHYVFTDY